MNNSLFALIGLSFFLGCGCWLFFLWGVQKGEFSDMERPKHRMLDDDEPAPTSRVETPPLPHPDSDTHDLTLSNRGAETQEDARAAVRAVPHR
ncbi:cbb3-type cytochrome oxidase assembly protein CcoS [Geomonas oryzisoli]|uniref:Cbb3-type cytochrome oxidase assembly protein CcoS n=1 Tax=Geomonas oryzisoli TaxID=2847992 RepID=A0ABX8J412_9BACT|nr:cbb3-type cytochrome oxidase assembly protein CcoS [Geomonas oryzisoli]QWV92294.1 cbb3-type cytochrome oxidase assembly protein CcoS [Geomonas oryzisoli]